MALEQVFECPRTLSRLRNGPLGKLLEGFCDWLLSHGFSRWTIRTHLCNVSHLNAHLGGSRNGIRESLSTRDVEDFFEIYHLQCRNRGPREKHVRQVGSSVKRFFNYLRESGLLDPLPRQEIYHPLLDAYLKWMRHYQHASNGTLEVRRNSIAQFLQWLGPEATPEGLLRLTAERIEDFFLSYAQSNGPIRTPLNASGLTDLLALLFAPRLCSAPAGPGGSHIAYLQAEHSATRTERGTSTEGH